MKASATSNTARAKKNSSDGNFPEAGEHIHVKATSERGRRIALSDVNWSELVPRLLKIAYVYATKYHAGPDPATIAEEAVQSAIVKTLSGERKWNEDINLQYFLIMVIRSLISNEARKYRQFPKEADVDALPSQSVDAATAVELQSSAKAFVTYLKEEQPDMLPIMEALVNSDGKAKDVAARLGMSPSALSKKRKRLSELAEKFRDQEEKPDYAKEA